MADKCDRAGCTNGKWKSSKRYGNICYNCFEELVDSGPETDIRKFMATPEAEYGSDDRYEAEARYEAAFPESNYE
jgi:hypothetical protein